MRKKLMLFLVLNVLFFQLGAQTNEVSLVVSSKGTTEEEARTNALRSAIEQAFGTFVSARTEILDDELVQDQIVSVSNGNIKKFEILSSLYLAEQKSHLITLNATVSLDKLTSFVQSKGYNDVSFDGGGFAMNLKIQKLNEKSEIIAIRNLIEQGLILSEGFFDRNLKVGDPRLEASNDPSQNKYQVPLSVNSTLNSNWITFHDYYIKTLKKISMSKDEVISYKAMNKKVYVYFIVEKIVQSKHNDYPNLTVESWDFLCTDTLSFRTQDALYYLESYNLILNAKYLDGIRILHTLDTIDLDIEYNTSYSLASYRDSESLSDLWFTERTYVLGHLHYKLPFVQSYRGVELGSVRSKSDPYVWVQGIRNFSWFSPDCVMEIYNFTSNGHRLDSNEAAGEFIMPLINALNSRDYASSLKFLSENIKKGEMPKDCFLHEDDHSIFEINNQLTTTYEVKINVSFTEEELGQIKGFKLIK
jgi:hypothetical protein